jgi:hypothetical protein
VAGHRWFWGRIKVFPHMALWMGFTVEKIKISVAQSTPAYFLHCWACRSIGCLGYSCVEFLAMEIFL